MTTAEFIGVLRQRDIRLLVDGGRLRVSAPPGALTEEWRAELARRKDELLEVLQAAAGGAAALEAIDRTPDLPLSSAQQRLWLLHELDPGNAAYHVVFADRIHGPLDLDRLAAAWHALVARQESLRTRIVAIDGTPHAVIDAPAPGPFRLVDASGDPTRLEAILDDEAHRPFDLEHGPLAAVTVVRTGEDEHVLIVRLHHIVCDEWSIGVLRREFAALYAAARDGVDPDLPSLPVQYVDYASWQRDQLTGPRWDRLAAYWRGVLRGIEPIELPRDRSRTASEPAGDRILMPLPDDLMARLTRMGTARSATMFMVMAAAFAAVLHRLTGRSDVSFGIPVAGRERAETEHVIGVFINTLVLRLRIAASDSFEAVIEQVRQVTLDAYAHQDAPFDRLVAMMAPTRDLTRAPLAPVMFNLLNTPSGGSTFAGLRTSGVTLPRRASALDMTALVDVGANELAIEFRSDLISPPAARRFASLYLSVLDAIATDPAVCVGALPTATPEERAWLLGHTPARVAYDAGQSIERIVEARAAETPEAIAVVCGTTRLTYAELDARAGRLARRLKSLGVGPDVLVGVCVQRSVDMPVAVLGVLGAGGAYVPLDPVFPSTRLAMMVEDASLAFIVTDAASESALPGTTSRVVRIDRSGTAAGDIAVPASTDRPTGEHLAYVLFTSGSTGRPKGVQIPRRALTNFLLSMRDRPGLAASDVVLGVTTLSFDIAGLELFLPLSVGATLVIAERDAVTDGPALARLLEQHQVTLMQATPATWRLLVDSGWAGSSRLTALCGGEAFPPDLVPALRDRTGAVWNMYGPTETTVWSTIEPVTDATAPVSIGRPIANTSTYVMDAALQLALPGAVGELFIGGDGVARGYVNQPELTASRFLPDPFSDRPGARMYRTGDLARVLEDGRLECFGRVDHQVKVRGFRIELGEIESVLAEHPDVGAAAVTVADRPSGPILVAYVTAHGREIDPGVLDRHLRARLPAYMVPSFIGVLDPLPLTPNGKIDRKALPDPHVRPRVAAGSAGVDPSTETERRLADIWKDVLSLPAVGRQDDFFALGGHSLLVAQVMARVQRLLGVALPPGTLFRYPTLAELAACIDEQRTVGSAAQSGSSIVPMERGGAGRPLFWLHGLGGEVFSYLAVSRHVGRTRPVFGFSADWNERFGSQPLTLDMVASQYVDELVALEPSGPYHLAGYCSGALLALAMARELRGRGHAVGAVVAVDFDMRSWQQPASRGVVPWLFLYNLPLWLRDDVLKSSRSDLAGRVRSLARRLALRIGLKRPKAEGAPDIRDALGMWRLPAYQVRMIERHNAVFASYRPQPYRGRVTLILASAMPAVGPFPVGPHTGWSQLALGGLDVHQLRGSHSTILAAPFAERVAESMEQAMAEAERRAAHQVRADGAAEGVGDRRHLA